MRPAFDIVLKNARLLEGAHPLDIAIRQGCIAALQPLDATTGQTLDVGGRRVIPGFIDLHIQGAGGADVLDATPGALQTMAKTLARLGTTAFLATSVIFPEGDNRHLRHAAEAMQTPVDGARILGIHLEGPYINPLKKGGLEPRCIYDRKTRPLTEVLDICGGALKMMTLAPELPGHLDLIDALLANGVVPALGHSHATYAETQTAFAAGIRHVTHLFNAMPGLSHREPGPLLAIFEHPEVTAQLISDGVHVHPGMVRLVSRLIGIERCIPITDGVQAIGLPEGRYIYNGRDYESRDGTARYLDGTLIGSALGMADIVWRFQRFTGCSLQEAVTAGSWQAARVLGVQDRKGRIAVGLDADLVVLNEDHSVWATLVEGLVVWRAP